jgi:hypothetical protein
MSREVLMHYRPSPLRASHTITILFLTTTTGPAFNHPILLDGLKVASFSIILFALTDHCASRPSPIQQPAFWVLPFPLRFFDQPNLATGAERILSRHWLCADLQSTTPLASLHGLLSDYSQ